MSGASHNDLETFDYVIVGAGPSAMGILYCLLESHVDTDEDVSGLPFSIAVIERGEGPPHDTSTQSPHRWYEAAYSRNSTSVRLYPSSIMGRRVDIPVGQGLGGTSNINACLCLPPLEEDMERWPDPWKHSLVDSARYLLKVLESNGALQYGEDDLTSNNNPFYSSMGLTGAVPTMASKDTATGGSFVRENYYSGLVAPFLQRYPRFQNSITWFRGVEAQRLITNGTNVIGVECLNLQQNNDSMFTLRATKRTILCAGAIETPALLLVSSPGADQRLSGIGKKLKDQALLARAHLRKTAQDTSAEQSVSGIAALGHWKHATYGLFQLALADFVSLPSILPRVAAMPIRWKCSSKCLTHILNFCAEMIQFASELAICYTPLGFVLKRWVLVSMVFLMHPRSDGTVTIHPKNIHRMKTLRRRDVEVEVDPGYLQDDQDFDALSAAWEDLQSQSTTSFLEVFPKPLLLLLRFILPQHVCFQTIFCRFFLQPYYHFAGTCAMSNDGRDTKNDADWVVESSTLRLRGYDGRYICDASVFPSMISNPPALTCASLGYQFGKMIVVADH
ncbi:glucose-methanol-choline oxidoreductase [Nitzschia inconspicua]|uniref:Glucose-methanol-choline oxidoreductase n=1 Tax=Nitzschia inconspicua TaxID=303405 RepID=A0A9K3LGY5_9STRA|nr:glucose-methanol-choline oxidoreductase [Nitzschia inconspicua]